MPLKGQKKEKYFFPHICLCGCGEIIFGAKNFIFPHQAKSSSSKRGNISGRNNPNFGNNWTEEQKLASHNKMINRYDGINNPFYNKKHTEESKHKLSNNRRGKALGIRNAMNQPAAREKISIKTTERWKISQYRERMTGVNAPMFGKKGKKSPSYGKPPAHGKRIYYQSPLQRTVCFRSSWEAAYAKYLDAQNILWYYEIQTFELSGEMTYTPDFFLPQQNKFIEIKGRCWSKESMKFQKFQEEYPFDIEILFKNDLKSLGVI